MKLKKKALVAALGAMMVSGAASAVQVNPKGLGDMLIAPAYMIGGGWQTQVRVVNTSMTDSVVAKVIVHHNVSSAELLDFMIFLSPGDEWLGTMSCTKLDANAVCTAAQFASSDDSMQIPGTVNAPFATAATPAVYPIKTIDTYGYVTITESSRYAVPPFSPGVLKTNILAQHMNGTAAIATTDTPNVLTGTVTILNGNQQASIAMLALADYNNGSRLVPGGLTEIGRNNGTGASTSDVEDALWSNNYVIPYQVDANSGTIATFTYPTKMSYRGAAAVGQYPFGVATAAKSFADAPVFLNAVAFDMSENVAGCFNCSPPPQPLPTQEASWLVVGTDIGLTQPNGNTFTSGWVNINYLTPARSNGQTQSVAQNYLNNGGAWQGGATSGTAGAPGIVTYFSVAGNQLNWQYAPSY